MASKGAIVKFILCTLFILQRFEVDVCIGLYVPSAADSRNGHQNNRTAVYLNTSGDVIIRVGERLQLNCTITGTMNSTSFQLSWYYGKRRLTNITNTLSNDTLQLVIEHVSWNNNGSYICKKNGNGNAQSKEVLVRVGEIPSPPQNVWTNNVEFTTRIHWTSPTHSGGLPLHYAVKGQCKNVSMQQIPNCGLEPFTLCESSLIISNPGSNKLECRVSTLLYIAKFVTYSAFVEASNALGTSTSDPVEFKHHMFNPLLTTPDPQPSMSFSAKEVTPGGTVKLSWIDAKQLRFFKVQYTILYHRDGDSTNKTLILHSPRTYELISGLSGFSLYHFYLFVQYGGIGLLGNKTGYGTYSRAAVRTVKTKISAPRQPPTVTNCSKWSNLSNSIPELEVTWNVPPPESLNGPLENMSMIISRHCWRGLYEKYYNSTVSVTAWSASVPALQHYDRCSVWMKICNGPFCSATSNTCIVRSLKDNSFPSASKLHIQTIVAIVAGGTLGGLLLVAVVLFFISRRSNNGERRVAIANFLEEMLPAAHGYEEIDDPPENHNYDVVNM